jgi:hypothetical protein
MLPSVTQSPNIIISDKDGVILYSSGEENQVIPQWSLFEDYVTINWTHETDL